MRQYEVFEIQIKGQEPKGSHVDVDITGFFEMNGKKNEVKGFYAGADTWIVRFCPEEAGACKYQIKGHDGAGETFEQTGSVECESASGRHGIVRTLWWNRHLKRWHRRLLIRFGCAFSRSTMNIMIMNRLVMHLKRQMEHGM